MKDFDAERHERHREREAAMGDRQFLFGGEVFVYRANPQYNVLRDVSSITNDTTGNEVIDMLEQTVVNLLETDDNAHARFRTVCQRTEGDTITFQDLNELATWLIEAQVETPTPAPSSSTNGGATTTTESTGSSSSTPAAASAT